MCLPRVSLFPTEINIAPIWTCLQRIVACPSQPDSQAEKPLLQLVIEAINTSLFQNFMNALGQVFGFDACKAACLNYVNIPPIATSGFASATGISKLKGKFPFLTFTVV